MREISLHILDIAENSIAANASCVQINVTEDLKDNVLSAQIIDNGKGMDERTVAMVVDPFVTSRTTRKVGLGIPLLKAAAESTNGYLTIASELGKGTQVNIEFQYDHIDRMPLGDLAGTFLTLLVSFPTIQWKFRYFFRDKSMDSGNIFLLDTSELSNLLDGCSYTEPEILSFLRTYFENGISDAHHN